MFAILEHIAEACLKFYNAFLIAITLSSILIASLPDNTIVTNCLVVGICIVSALIVTNHVD